MIVTESLTEMVRQIEHEHRRRIDLLEADVKQLKEELKEERRHHRALIGRMADMEWTG